MFTTSFLDIRQSREPERVPHLDVTGELDAETAPRLLESLRQTGGADARMRLDLSGVTFIDCSGLSILLAGLREARRKGCLVEVEREVSRSVERMIEMTGVHGLLWP